MEKDEFLEELKGRLDIEGDINYTDDGTAQIELTDDEWQKVQVWLDNNEELDFDEESSTVSSESNLQYINDRFIINLIADLEGSGSCVINVKDIGR